MPKVHIIVDLKQHAKNFQREQVCKTMGYARIHFLTIYIFIYKQFPA